MADNLTNTAENLVLDWVNSVGTPTRPTTPLKLALCTTAPTDAAAGTEVTGGSYARQNANLGAAASGAATNSAEIRFTGMPAVGGSGVTHVELWDSFTTPVRIWYGALATAKTVNAGDDFVIAAGQLTVTLS